MTESPRPTVVFVEHVLWSPDDAWTAALEHVAGRFARVSPLDVDAVLAAGPLHAQLDLLASWAADAKLDLERELGRFLDEHLSMHVRPAPTTTRAVRALAATGDVHLVSALPARAAESITRHAGCWRSVHELHADVRDAAALRAVLDQVGTDRVVAGDSSPLPDGVTAAPLT